MTSTAYQPSFTGRIKEITSLFLPIALTTCSGCLVLLIHELFLARVSEGALEAVVNVTYVCRVLQAPCLSLGMMAQVFVGRQQGANQHDAIGRIIWQFVWFCLLSSLITIPLSVIYGYLYFQGTVLEDPAMSYFYILTTMNILYPLAATLSCFYLGRGKTRLVLTATLAAHLTNLPIAYALIFGVSGWMEPLGLIGSALSMVLMQGGLCLFFLCTFLSQKNELTYKTWDWHFQPKLFWNHISPGLPRALNRISAFLCWACIARLMIEKQGDYLLIWSVGGAITLFLPFIGEAICQALTTVTSNVVGGKNFHLLTNVNHSGVKVISTISLIMAIPLLLLPEASFQTLFPDITLMDMSVRRLFFSLWLSFSFWTLSYIPISHLLAFKDTRFFLFTGISGWLSSFGSVYLAICYLNVAADYLWAVLAFGNLVDLVLYWSRAEWLKNQQTSEQTSHRSWRIQMPMP